MRITTVFVKRDQGVLRIKPYFAISLFFSGERGGERIDTPLNLRGAYVGGIFVYSAQSH